MLDVDAPCVVLDVPESDVPMHFYSSSLLQDFFSLEDLASPLVADAPNTLGGHLAPFLLLGCVRLVSGHTEDFCVDVHMNKLYEHTAGVSLKEGHMALSSTTCCTICLSFWFEARNCM